MMRSLCFLSIFVFSLCQTWTVSANCSDLKDTSQTISVRRYMASYQKLENCWTINVPANQFVQININKTDFPSSNCNNSYLRITISKTNENYTFCNNGSTKRSIIAPSDVQIYLYYYNPHYYGRSFEVSFSYKIQDIGCDKKKQFQCSDYWCIPNSQVCDKVQDCENGADEVGCETNIERVPGVLEARSKAISWLISKRTPSWGWNDNTPRAVTALFLAGGANFNGTDLKEELMAKQAELKTSVALLKNSLPNEQLSMFINSLLVTCHNPRRFYGHNLIKSLKDGVSTSRDLVHPIVYLTLCIANESWPQQAFTDLNKTLSSQSLDPFFKDYQAFSVMAVSCYGNYSGILNKTEITILQSLSKKIIQQFKEHQLSDGSFGNTQTTSVITQALLASGHGHGKNWNLNATLKYLINKLNSSHVSFLENYLTLPILNGKSMLDIAKVNCSVNPKKNGEDDPASEFDDYIGPMMRLQYSLFIGDDKDIIHTISLKVPENFTAYELMQYAEKEDYKFKFESKRVSDKLYIYKIGKVINDPEAGKFWLLYLGSTNTSAKLLYSTTSPQQLVLRNEDHLVMWYKRAHLQIF